jgi:hypothetical protein
MIERTAIESFAPLDTLRRFRGAVGLGTHVAPP